MKLKLYFFFLILLFNSDLYAQLKDTLSSEATLPNPLKLNGRGVDYEAFNKGFNIDPMQAFQGKIPALLMAKAGNDPNGVFDAQIRGIKSLNNISPLFLVDGFPVQNLEGIHVEDIASVEVLANGGTSLWLGAQGGRGLISIKTKSGLEEGLSINYNHIRASDALANKPELLSPESFRRNGGDYFGSSTDWWEAITRNAQSQRHYLSLAGGNSKSKYFLSLGYDQIEGVVKTSDFQRFNGRFNFQQAALNDRLLIKANFSGSTKTSGLVAYDAFIHATQYNPTAPIYGEGSTYDRYGGYFENQIWRNYNPIAILEQTQYDQISNQQLAQLEADFKLSENISFNLGYANSFQSRHLNAYLDKKSLYNSLDFRNGSASQVERKQNNQILVAQVHLKKEIKEWSLNSSLRAFQQEINFENFRIETFDFLTDAFSYNNLGASAAIPRGEGYVTSGRSKRLVRGYGALIQLNKGEDIGINANINWEGASNLGLNQKWGLYYGINAFKQLNESWTLNASYAKMGSLPDRQLLSQETYTVDYQSFYHNGSFQPILSRDQEANPDLKAESIKEWTIGLDFHPKESRFSGGLSFYSNQATDLINEHYIGNDPLSLGRIEYRNSGGISNTGIEFYINYDFIQKPNFSWQMNFSGSRYFNSILTAYEFNYNQQEEFIGIIGGLCTSPIFRLAVGSPLGEIHGFEIGIGGPVSRDGSWNFADQNGDRWITFEDDYTAIGNVLPKLTLAISNQIDWGKWQIDFMLRGAFGHDMVNHIRSLYSAPSFGRHYNILASGPSELRGLTSYPEFTDRDVESGSFLRLDYINFSYDLTPKRKSKSFSSLELYAAAQNLFTISPYSGLNPELRLIDRDYRNPLYGSISQDRYSGGGNPLVQGMERRNTYPLAKTFLMGIRLGLK